jgi:leucyl aminopeptidase
MNRKEKNMRISVTTQKVNEVDSDLLVFLFDEQKRLFAPPPEPLGRYVAEFRNAVKTGKSKAEDIITFPSASGRPMSYLTHTKFIKYHSFQEKIKIMVNKALAYAKDHGQKRIAFVLDNAEGCRATPYIVEGILLGTYRFESYKRQKEFSFYDDVDVSLVCRREERIAVQKHLERTQIICDVINRCRTVVNETLEQVNPESLAGIAREVASANNLECEVLDEKRLLKEGYNAILAVGRGSTYPPRLVIMRYNPSRRSRRHLCIVGKGVTFDCGGINLKTTGDRMWLMKTDMSGAATAIFLMDAIAKLKPQLRVTAIAPLVHNAIDARAIVPGHVIRAKNGKTIHVINTDAEGRLILTDALARAGEEGATHIVDVATLTGSIIRALHTSLSGIFGNNRAFVNKIIEIGKRCGEDFWQLPLYDEYGEMLESTVGDINNVATSPDGGAITAALFLREFVPAGVAWAHLDIAGTAVAADPLGQPTWKYFGPGATAVAFRTLIALCHDLV